MLFRQVTQSGGRKIPRADSRGSQSSGPISLQFGKKQSSKTTQRQSSREAAPESPTRIPQLDKRSKEEPELSLQDSQSESVSISCSTSGQREEKAAEVIMEVTEVSQDQATQSHATQQ